MARYELILVYAEQTTQEQIDASTAKIKGDVEGSGGTLDVTPWGKRELAYEIENNRYGHYVQLNIECAAGFTSTLEAKLRVEDEVMRYLTIKAD